jgi:hypothetical protein
MQWILHLAIVETKHDKVIDTVSSKGRSAYGATEVVPEDNHVYHHVIKNY